MNDRARGAGGLDGARSRRRQRRAQVMRALRALVLWLASVAARFRVTVEVGHQRWRGLP